MAGHEAFADGQVWWGFRSGEVAEGGPAEGGEAREFEAEHCDSACGSGVMWMCLVFGVWIGFGFGSSTLGLDLSFGFGFLVSALFWVLESG